MDGLCWRRPYKNQCNQVRENIWMIQRMRLCGIAEEGVGSTGIYGWKQLDDEDLTSWVYIQTSSDSVSSDSMAPYISCIIIIIIHVTNQIVLQVADNNLSIKKPRIERSQVLTEQLLLQFIVLNLIHTQHTSLTYLWLHNLSMHHTH